MFHPPGGTPTVGGLRRVLARQLAAEGRIKVVRCFIEATLECARVDSASVYGEAGAEWVWKFDHLAVAACDVVHGREEADVEEEPRRKSGSWLGFTYRGRGREEGKDKRRSRRCVITSLIFLSEKALSQTDTIPSCQNILPGL